MLNSILPTDEIIKRFDKTIIVKEYGFSEINEIAELSQSTCSQIGMSAWDRLIQLGVYKGDPMALAKHVNSCDPKIHMKVANIIGRRIIDDIYYTVGELEDEELEEKQVFEFMVTHMHPKSLYLADILLQNPYQPIPENERTYIDQIYKGFGLLGEVMSNLDKTAKNLGCDVVTLTAARADQIPLFKIYGFSVRDSDVGKLALQYGVGIPMDKSI